MQEIDPSLVAALARDLHAGGCDALSLPELIGDEAVAAMARQVSAPARRALEGRDEAWATLIAAFMLGDGVEPDRLGRALPTLGLDGATTLGLVEVTDDVARTTLAIRPWLARVAGVPVSWWIASDHDELSSNIPLSANHVLGVGGAGRTLAALVPTEPVDTALDLGSGCGLISLILAQSADHVVATDISERALWCTALTCALNDVTNVETRLGSLLEPVRGEHFDRIASNPPFVISPRTDAPALEYRDGGFHGDDVMAALVRNIPDHLTPHGSAIMLGNWEYTDQDGLDRVLDWADSAPCWVIEREQLTPSAYVDMWIRDGGILPSSHAGAAIAAPWLDDFAARRVKAIGLGWILLRHGTGAQRAERVTHPLDVTTVGAHLEAASEALGIVASLSDAQLASLHLMTAPDVTDVRHFRPGATDPSAMELHQGGGLARTVQADTALMALVGALDGDFDVASLVDAIAGIVGVDGEELLAELLPKVRELLVTGMVTVVDGG